MIHSAATRSEQPFRCGRGGGNACRAANHHDDQLIGIEKTLGDAAHIFRGHRLDIAVAFLKVIRTEALLLDPDKLVVVVVGRPAGVTATAPAPEGLF